MSPFPVLGFKGTVMIRLRVIEDVRVEIFWKTLRY